MCGRSTILLIWWIRLVHTRHFNGGTITWAPVDPYDNSSSIPIIITQSYAWTYPLINCATDVPISTVGRSTQNTNLSCMADCGTDGGYSQSPINILTDCQSASSSLSMLSSQRSTNISLLADAHFYLAFVGSAWVSLNDPAQNGLQWSIVTYIDLRRRPDGFINTPPVASVVSPRYVFVNQTTEINIPVSDVNAGDDVRCRWSTYIPGYRRRRSQLEEPLLDEDNGQRYSEILEIRQKRQSCPHGCTPNANCNSAACQGTNCTGLKCTEPVCCGLVNVVSTTTVTTTIETAGTIKSTSSFPQRQAIDECGGICYPDSLPNGTTLSNCTITFTGTKVNTWYGVSIQVEDFIDKNSSTPMSSVPVQLLIYVRGPPTCPTPPVMVPLNICQEVQVGAPVTFDVYATNLCDPSISVITDIVPTSSINGMTWGTLRNVTANASLSSVTFTWVPQANQVGSRSICFVAYTVEQISSSPSCFTFTVELIANSCVIITTTSTQSTTTTTSVTVTTVSTISSITTTKASSTSQIDWPLILGLSLLGLLLALCCVLCCLYWLLWRPAKQRRRKRYQNRQDPVQTFSVDRDTSSKMDLPSRSSNRITNAHTPTKDRLIDHAETMHRMTPSDLRINVSESPAPIDDPKTPIPLAVKVTSIQRQNTIGLNDETGIDDLITHQTSYVISPNQSRFEESGSLNEDHPTTQSNQSIYQPKFTKEKTPRVTLEKIPRNQRIVPSKPRRSSVGNISMVDLERSAIDTPLMANRVRPGTQPDGTRKITAATVHVTKVSRSRSTIHPTDS